MDGTPSVAPRYQPSWQHDQYLSIGLVILDDPRTMESRHCGRVVDRGQPEQKIGPANLWPPNSAAEFEIL
jgi:hypothetical protein